MNSELEEKGYIIYKNFIRKDLAEYIATHVLEEKEKGHMYENDGWVNHASFCYNSKVVRTLHLHETERLSSVCQKTLSPTYCFTRIYYKDGELKPHTDRYECEYSITLHLQGNKPWEIYMENYTTKEHTAVLLEPGDAVIYKGCDILHYRKPYDGDWYVQCFLHYVDNNGPKYTATISEVSLPIFSEIYIPFITKWNKPISSEIRTQLLQITEYHTVGDGCQQSKVIHEKNNLNELQQLLTKELKSIILPYTNEYMIITHYGSHDILQIDNGKYIYSMNDVKTFYIATIYVLRGECMVYFPGFEKTLRVKENEALVIPISYAYNCTISGTCSILRSFLI